MKDKKGNPAVLENALIITLGDRISSNKKDIQENLRAIKRLYIWQSTVGISLLVFFLTIGIAALRYVDRMNYDIQSNVKSINKIETLLEKQKEEKEINKDSLKRIISEAIKESKNSN